MKKFIIVMAAMLGMVSAAHAQVTSPWTQAKLAPTVYSAGTTNSSFFITPTTIPTGSVITSVSWVINPYTNGATVQEYRVCYTQRYASSPYQCHDTVVGAGNTNVFNGYDAKGSFSIQVKLTGGTYPVYPSHTNTITVGFN